MKQVPLPQGSFFPMHIESKYGKGLHSTDSPLCHPRRTREEKRRVSGSAAVRQAAPMQTDRLRMCSAFDTGLAWHTGGGWVGRWGWWHASYRNDSFCDHLVPAQEFICIWSTLHCVFVLWSLTGVRYRRPHLCQIDGKPAAYECMQIHIESRETVECRCAIRQQSSTCCPLESSAQAEFPDDSYSLCIQRRC